MVSVLSLAFVKKEGTMTSEPPAGPSSAGDATPSAGDTAPSAFNFSSVDLPKPGDKLVLDGKEVTVLSPVGRNGRPLRSKLFEVGVMFEPRTDEGQDFLCCVPIPDSATGKTRRCGALLKIPKGSLGNPLRHVKKKHYDAYCCISKESLAKKDRDHAKAPSEKRKRARGEDGETSGQGGQSRPGFSGNFGGQKGLGLGRKCVAFCCNQLLPLDAAGKESFAAFVRFIGRTGQVKLLRTVTEATSSLYYLLEREAHERQEALVGRIGDLESQFYWGLPFLDVSVDHRFVPVPAVRISFRNERGKVEEAVLVGGATSAARLRQQDSDQALEAGVRDIFGEYGLEGAYPRLVQRLSVVQGGERRPLGPPATRSAYISGYLNHDAGRSREEVLRVFEDCCERKGLRDDLCKEMDAYESLARGGGGGDGLPWDAAAFFGRQAEAESSGEGRFPLIFRLACSVQLTGEAPQDALQTTREVRIIQAKDFIVEGYDGEFGTVEELTRRTLFIKHNSGLAKGHPPAPL